MSSASALTNLGVGFRWQEGGLLISGAALATVVGVLIEMPPMLMLVKICLRTGNWFRRG